VVSGVFWQEEYNYLSHCTGIRMINRFTVAPRSTTARILAAVAAGRQPPDFIIRGARILSTYSERIICDGKSGLKKVGIAAVKPAGSYPLLPGDHTRHYDAEGGIIATGLGRSHVNLVGSMMTACAYAEAALLKRHDKQSFAIARPSTRVFGPRGLNWFLADACHAPFSVFVKAVGFVSGENSGIVAGDDFVDAPADRPDADDSDPTKRSVG